jgi:hypothetical protein
MRRWLTGGALVALLVATASAADVVDVVIEDWTGPAVGTRGIPPGWAGQSWGMPAYDFTVVEDEGRRALHLRSRNDSSTITREFPGEVDLHRTPILEWSWKVVTLPAGGDSRRKETDDQAGQVYVVWPRFPKMVRSRIIGYIWDTTAPAGTVVRSEKTGMITYVILRSGPDGLGRWITERRNVVEDFRRIYGEEPDSPGAVSIAIDSNDVDGTAEALIGAIRFRAP